MIKIVCDYSDSSAVTVKVIMARGGKHRKPRKAKA